MSLSLSSAFRSSQSRLLVAAFAGDQAGRFASLDKPFCWQPYTSLLEMMEHLDEIEAEAGENATVVLVLDERFCGHLPSIIDRDNLGGKLVVASQNGKLPELATCSHPEVISVALGWRQIRFTTDAWQAIQDEAEKAAPGREVIVLWPA